VGYFRLDRFLSILILFCATVPLTAATNAAAFYELLDSKSAEIEERVIAWRRDFHEFPELSNREFRTSKIVAEHLRSLGIEVQTEIAHTGVVGVLRGAKAEPVVALRADMDGLPIVERTGLPFASKVKSEYLGREVGVMHACGHDAHVAILMGAAEILASVKDEIPGTVKFIFQPAEEGAPPGEEGGAELMVKEGVMQNPDVDVVFGLHISSQAPLHMITYRPEGFMASSDRFEIVVRGKQSHGASPWNGVDPVAVSAQIVLGLQTIVSRQMDLTRAPAVISVGSIQGGVRSNIIPEEVKMIGTIRALDDGMRKDIHKRVKRTVKMIAESAGAAAEVSIDWGYGVTYNDPGLTEQMVPTLRRVTGRQRVMEIPPITGAEDFSFYAEEVPGLFFFLGALSPDTPPEKAPGHHTPEFVIDEASFVTGVRAMLYLTLDYMNQY
jgi:amidohydrolase